MPPDVTVSIVNHESRDDVLASLRALEDDATRTRSLQVIVVDNASRDGSAEAFAQAFPRVELIARRTRAGYGANHNLALARAEGAYVLFLNDDAVVRPGAIDAPSAIARSCSSRESTPSGSSTQSTKPPCGRLSRVPAGKREAISAP